MFKTIVQLNRITTLYPYRLHDTCFATIIKSGGNEFWDYRILPVFIKEYEVRNLHVVKAIADYYKYVAKSVPINIQHLLINHNVNLKRYFPALRFDTKYYPLLYNYYLRGL